MAKIVLVEDDEELRRLVVDELEEAGHVLVEAGDGIEGISKIKKEAPDVIIADINLPQMDGYQLWKRLKSCPLFASTPFFFMSALALQQVIDQGLSIDEEDLLTKPVDFDILRSRIANCFA